MPALGFGTWRLAGDLCYHTVRTALDAGYRHIDTAQTYFNEEEIGRAIRDSGLDRQMLFLTTKLSYDRVDPAQVFSTTEHSLARLKTYYVDLLLIHWPSKITPLVQTLEAMAELVQHEKVRHIGVSNFPSALLREACRLSTLPILANQVEYHPYLSQTKLLETCVQEGVMLTAYAPTARARVVQDETLIRIGQRYGKSSVQVALRWLIQQPLVSAIPKSAHADWVRSNFDVFDFELTEEEMQTIFALGSPAGRMLNPEGIAPKWDE